MQNNRFPETQLNSSGNNNLVDNFRLYLARKFSQKNRTEKKDETLTVNPFASNELSKSFDIKTLERYKKILEEHKNVLPKDFRIRNFPHSSCQNTFDSHSAVNNASEETKTSRKEFTAAEKETNNSNNVNNLNNDSENSLNKRFYHVFKENELNSLISVSCPDVNVYKTYYDHGNWCICGIKEK